MMKNFLLGTVALLLVACGSRATNNANSEAVQNEIDRVEVLYTLGRAVAYTALGIVLLVVLQSSSSLFGIQKFVGKYGEMLLGPALLLIGAFMLVGDRLNLPKFGFKGNGEGLARHGSAGAFLFGCRIMVRGASCRSVRRYKSNLSTNDLSNAENGISESRSPFDRK